MKKHQIFLSGVITTITALWPFITASYIALVISLSWFSLLIFPLFYAIIAIVLTYIYRDADITFDKFIEKRIKSDIWSKRFLKVFKKSKFIALAIASFWLCPLITPILTKLCVKKNKNAYFLSALLNFITTMLWIDRKSTRLNSSHTDISRMPSSA